MQDVETEFKHSNIPSLLNKRTMDNKLELKHLAPYLPYGLKGNYVLSHVIKLSNGQKDEVRDKILTEENLQFFRLYCKPILRPLSDLTKENTSGLEESGMTYLSIINKKHSYRPAYRIDQELDIIVDASIDVNIDFYEYYGILNLLYTWHFDVFGLIEKGLAIDINTLEDG